jgi:hypothetical protein
LFAHQLIAALAPVVRETLPCRRREVGRISRNNCPRIYANENAAEE